MTPELRAIITDHVATILAGFPKPTDDQLERVAALLRSTGAGAGGCADIDCDDCRTEWGGRS